MPRPAGQLNVLMLAPQPFFQNRGTPLAVRMLAQTLASLGHRVDLLVYHEGEDVSMPGVRLLRTMRLPGIRRIRPGPSIKKAICDATMLAGALRRVSTRPYDLVHAVEESVFIAMALRQIARLPYLYDMDSSLAEQTGDKWHLPRPLVRILEAMERSAVRHSIGVVAVCRALEERARRYDPGKLIVRLEDVSLLEPTDHRAELRNTFGLVGPIVMYVGNLESYQGIDLLLESFAKAQRRVSDSALVIVGGEDGDIARYRAMAQQLEIGPEVHFLGPRPVHELSAYLAEADVLVSPRCRGGNTPMKIYSYLASGKPVLATRLPTHTQVLDDRVALLTDADAQAMADGMVQLLQNRSLRDELGRRGRERAQRQFSPEAFRKKLADLYTHVAADILPSIDGKTQEAPQP